MIRLTLDDFRLVLLPTDLLLFLLLFATIGFLLSPEGESTTGSRGARS